MMLRLRKKWIASILSGSVLLQTTACVQNAVTIGSLSSVVTAGGVLYIVSRILRD